MSTTELLVVVSGVALIAWVNWYFLGSSRSAARAEVSGSGVQEVKIRVRGGYDPAEVRVRRGVPVRLIFSREESAGCSEEVVFGDLGIRKFLPPHSKTSVEFTPEEAGSHEFTCGMGMLRGRVTVEEGGA
jgi:plastocyanin domain-containing protein